MKFYFKHIFRYFNFGFIPTGNFRKDIYGKFFGHVNLMKRLQAPDIFKTLNILPDDRLLDFGCGMGFYTIEMAKVAKEAYGIDINPYIKTIQIPPDLTDRLKYIQVSGLDLPFPDYFFDKVLASEILPMIPDPAQFLKEIRRVLKPGGYLIVVNGAGHPAISKIYESQNWLFRKLKKYFYRRFPKSYEEYEEILQTSFGTGQKRFLKETDVRGMLVANGFSNLKINYTPGYTAGAFFSWSQFLLYLRTGKTLSQEGFFFKFLLFSFIRIFEKSRYKGGLLAVARRDSD